MKGVIVACVLASAVVAAQAPADPGADATITRSTGGRYDCDRSRSDCGILASFGWDESVTVSPGGIERSGSIWAVETVCEWQGPCETTEFAGSWDDPQNRIPSVGGGIRFVVEADDGRRCTIVAGGFFNEGASGGEQGRSASARAGSAGASAGYEAERTIDVQHNVSSDCPHWHMYPWGGVNGRHWFSDAIGAGANR